ncbi:Uncharacterized protein FVE85_5265 [Porphyridium purpureum]|uniref:FIST domain-containing protein n=1 Tax=Porphyridium purpureum TaxID=35688 RepID=A0A5J4Z327_PORPP|nr:Uncharacterized protein FVE85_5265 [Porphyridium purpureum]|eukprot:POR1810..scf295_1
MGVQVSENWLQITAGCWVTVQWALYEDVQLGVGTGGEISQAGKWSLGVWDWDLGEWVCEGRMEGFVGGWAARRVVAWHGNRDRGASAACLVSRCAACGVNGRRAPRDTVRAQPGRARRARTKPVMQVQFVASTVVDKSVKEAVPTAIRQLVEIAEKQSAAKTFRLAATPCVLMVFAALGPDPAEYELLLKLLRTNLAVRGVPEKNVTVIGLSVAAVGTDRGKVWHEQAIQFVLLSLEGSARVKPFVTGLADEEQQTFVNEPSRTMLNFNLDWRPSQWYDHFDVSNERYIGDRKSLSAIKFLVWHQKDYKSADLLSSLDFAFPYSVKLGGVAAPRPSAHEGLLLFQDRVFRSGVVGVAIDSQIEFDGAIAQGATKVGPLLRIMDVSYPKAEPGPAEPEESQAEASALSSRIIDFSAGQTIIEKVQEVNSESLVTGAPLNCLEMWKVTGVLGGREAKLTEEYLLAGIVIEPAKTVADITGKAGEKDELYITRKLMGFDEATGSLAINGLVRPGQLLAFQVRDREKAESELRKILVRLALEARLKMSQGLRPVGALLLTDEERGKFLFGQQSPHRELELYSDEFGENVPLCGMVLSGQIGQLPAPGFSNFFPTPGPQKDKGLQGGQTFSHDVVSAYFVVYAPMTVDAESQPATNV